MNNVTFGLVVGVLAGALGGFAATQLAPDAADGPIDTVVDTSSLSERLERIEQKLDRLDNPELTLRGTGTGPGTLARDDMALARMIAEQLDDDVRDSVRKSVREAWNDMGEPERASDPTGTRSKKRVPLSEAAAALELSGNEEDTLRGIYNDTIEKAIDIFAGEDGDREEVRRDFEALKADPSKRMTLLPKYMPKILPKIGEFIALEAERTQRITEAIGPEKAARLNDEFDIEERDPFGLQGNLRIESRGR